MVRFRRLWSAPAEPHAWDVCTGTQVTGPGLVRGALHVKGGFWTPMRPALAGNTPPGAYVSDGFQREIIAHQDPLVRRHRLESDDLKSSTCSAFGSGPEINRLEFLRTVRN